MTNEHAKPAWTVLPFLVALALSSCAGPQYGVTSPALRKIVPLTGPRREMANRPIADASALLGDDGSVAASRVLELILERSPVVLAARAAAEASLERRAQVVRLPDPQVRMGWYGEAVQTRTGAQRSVFTLQQSVPWPGKIAAAGDLADVEAQMMQAREWVAGRDAMVAGLRSYHELIYLQSALAVVDRIEGVAARLVEVAANAQVTRRAGIPELVRAETFLEQVRYDRLTFQELRDTEWQRLLSFVGLGCDSPVPTLQALAVPELDLRPPRAALPATARGHPPGWPCWSPPVPSR